MDVLGMEPITVKELKDMIDNEEYEITGGFPVGVDIGGLRCVGFARDGHAIEWVYQLRFGLNTYDDSTVITYDQDGEVLIRSAVNIGKYRV